MSQRKRSSLRPTQLQIFVVPVVLFTVAGCASTGATFRSGVGDTFLEHPPWYAGQEATAADATVLLGHLPVVYQRGASQPAIFDPSHSPAMTGLLEAMTAYLDSLQASVRLVAGGRVSAVAHSKTGEPPDVHFGCITETGAPGDDCEERDENSALGRGRQTMRLAVGRPSREWIEWIGPIMDEAGVQRTLVVTVEVGQYLIRQRGLAGNKEVELGTNHTARPPWLTSLETPVSVIQLTGALVGRDGQAIRIGAEGMLARRTSLPISAIGGQALITDEDVEALRTARREDLTGAPLVWQTALRILVTRLVGQAAATDARPR